jgi:pimeloyl-ACP methyl ester carboxylesterase
MKNWILFLVLFTSVLVNAQKLAEEEVELNYNNVNLYGTLLNSSTNDSTIVIIIPGSGPTDRDGNSSALKGKNNSLKYLAEDLLETGISSLRIDKRGVGESTDAMVKEEDLRFETYIGDVVHWIELLKQEKQFKKIVVAGHSEGSLIGIIAAQQTNVAGFISLAGTGISADEIIKKQLEIQPDLIKEEVNRVFEKLKVGDTVGDVNPMLFSLFRPSVQPYMISWLKYVPTEEISKLSVPILIIQGTTDIQVTVEDAEMLHKAQPKSELVLIEEMNHVFKIVSLNQDENIATYSNPAIKNAPQLANEIIQFINEIK